MSQAAAVGAGYSMVKAEYLVQHDRISSQTRTNSSTEEPVVKRTKVEGDVDGVEVEGSIDARDGGQEQGRNRGANVEGAERSKWSKKEKRGQNKNKNRPRTHIQSNDQKLCRSLNEGPIEGPCPNLPHCPFLHDIEQYLESSKDTKCAEKSCYMFETYGRCPRGLSCIYSHSHVDSANRNMVNMVLWNTMQPLYTSTHGNILDKETQTKLRRRQFDFKPVEKICDRLQADNRNEPETPEIEGKDEADVSSVQEVELVETMEKIRTCGATTDEDIIAVRKEEIKPIDWKDKLYLSPLTTVGNLPFRRLCVELGADITCSEMSLASSLVQGNAHEFALHRRHPSEKIWGVQLCSNNPTLAVKAAHILSEVGVDYDFVDLNMGCPLDPIFRQGAGSGLMCRANRLKSMVSGMSELLDTNGKPFTVKMRAGVKTDKYIAHNLIRICRNSGVSLVTLHGRTREQRYTKSANWDYIGQCVRVADPMPIFGNGDVLSWEEYAEKKSRANVAGVMIGRGALMKPWIFQEIKEQRNIDLNSTERLELIQRYANYGLDHWGSDSQGVETTRRFLLEWLSFFHRYVPVGILEHPPQKINEKPPRYIGRDEMESLLASGNSADWIKISERVLGPVPSHFAFLPKHKASSWA